MAYSKENLKNQKIIRACLIAFLRLLGSSELLNIRMFDISYHDTYMAVFIESSKTDKYRNGAW